MSEGEGGGEEVDEDDRAMMQITSGFEEKDYDPFAPTTVYAADVEMPDIDEIMTEEQQIEDSILEVANSVHVNIARVKYMIDMAFNPVRILSCEDSLYYVTRNHINAGFYDKPLYDMKYELEKKAMDKLSVLVLGPTNFMQVTYTDKEGNPVPTTELQGTINRRRKLKVTRVWNKSECYRAISVCFDVQFLCVKMRSVYEKFITDIVQEALSLNKDEVSSLINYIGDRVKLVLYFSIKYKKNVHGFINQNRVPVIVKRVQDKSIMPYVLTSFDDVNQLIQFPGIVLPEKKRVKTSTICLRCLKLSY
jgi:hypothetical protein